MKRAFTLIELMTVAGLMGLLATLSVVSWGVVTKGMSDRAAHEALEGFVRSAARVAAEDETRVVLRFCTHVIPADDDFDEEKIKPLERKSMHITWLSVPPDASASWRTGIRGTSLQRKAPCDWTSWRTCSR